TQTDGWMRLALDQYGIPHDYISVHDARDNPRLYERYDVILFGPSVNDPLQIVEGLQGDEPLPWKRSDVTPNIGRQASTDDMRGGLGLQGVLNLQRFVEQGGTLVTLTNSSLLPIHFGLSGGVGTAETPNLWAPGGVFSTAAADSTSPLVYGYDSELGVYFNRGPVFSDGARNPALARAEGGSDPGSTTARRSGRGGIDEQDIVQGRPRDMGQAAVEEFRRQQQGEAEQQGGFGGGRTVTARTVLRFASDPEDLLISGGLTNGAELAHAPALVDVPLGSGHVVMFSFNPFWRSQTLGSYSLVFNALLHHGNLDAGRITARTADQ
ncbi:MAG TPA: hypothetical protein VFZ69_00005, partial [Longimicrobiales bacterium]